MSTRQPVNEKFFRQFVGVKPSDILANGQALLSGCDDLLRQLEDDRALLGRLATKSSVRVRVEEFENPKVVVRNGLLYRNQHITKDAETARYHIAHVAMARFALREQIVPWLKAEARAALHALSQTKAPLTVADLDTLQPALQQLERAGSLCANLVDILQSYEASLGEACLLLDPSYPYTRRARQVADVYEFELTGAAYDILLSRFAGRHTPAPLIRTAVEVGIVRLVLDPAHTTKYRDCGFEPTRRISADAILDICASKQIPVPLGADTLKRLYEWGSVFVHWGVRYPHEELWYAVRLAEALRRGFLEAKDDEEADRYGDIIVEEARRRDLLRIYDKAGNLIPEPEDHGWRSALRAPLRALRRWLRKKRSAT